MIEPGRSIVGPAGVLLTKVLYRKQSPAKEFVIVDAAMKRKREPQVPKQDGPVIVQAGMLP